jgi:hypothetical protein
MKNKNLIIGGVILAGIVAFYFYNKNKGSVNMPSSTVGSAPMSSPNAPASPIAPTMGGIPKLYDNTSNCEEQYKEYMSKVRLTKQYISPKAQQERKQNWMKNNCKLKM